jgi:predicted ATPase
MRARSERYYRYQDLAVSEIDPDGKNFPMFLNSLNDELREDFSTWVADRFGYGVEVEQRSGHISINLKVGNYTTNIVDNGYGISQILPVLGQIWWASTGVGGRTSQTRRGQGSILVIEQPELHLHPAHQALIADAIVAERGNKGANAPSPVQFIIETHSEALVNRLGELVALGQIEPEDVQILIFEGGDDPAERLTNVRLAHFDDEGTLTNWPYGFFEPSV